MNEKVKDNRKNKRKISIITIFLLIFLAFTTTIVILNSTNKTNALEEIDSNIITGISAKELIEYEYELPDDIKEKLQLSGDIIYYTNGEEYIVAKEGSIINLAYKVTVTGNNGANYTVTDNEAKWIGGNLETGIIPESGEAIIYYIKSFEITEDTKFLENGSTVTLDSNLVSIEVKK